MLRGRSRWDMATCCQGEPMLEKTDVTTGFWGVSRSDPGLPICSFGLGLGRDASRAVTSSKTRETLRWFHQKSWWPNDAPLISHILFYTTTFATKSIQQSSFFLHSHSFLFIRPLDPHYGNDFRSNESISSISSQVVLRSLLFPFT